MAFSFHSFADCEERLKILPTLEAEFHQNALSILQTTQFSADDKDVESAHCLNKEKIGLQSMLKSLEEKESGSMLSKNVHGLDLEDEPEQIELLSKLLTVEDITFYGEIDQPTYQAPSGCKKVLCSAKSIFGEERGVKLLYALDKYGMNMSHLRMGKTEAWTNDEIDNLLEALDDLPETLLPIERNRTLAHHARGHDSGDVVANATMMFFDNYDAESKAMQRYTVIHEIGHGVGNKLQLHNSPDWLDISGWENRGGEWSAQRADTATSFYGMTNPAEDFAEAFAAYRYNPELLKEASEQKYAFMKNYVFQGLEYTDSESCLEKNSYLNQVEVEAGPQEIELSSCAEEAKGVLVGLPSVARMKRCLQRGLSIQALGEFELELDEAVDPIKVKESMRNFGLDYSPQNSKTPTDREVEDAYETILNSAWKGFTSSYYNVHGNCERVQKKGYKNFRALEDVVGDDTWTYDNKEDLNRAVKELCEADPKAMMILKDNPKMKERFFKLAPHKE